MSPEAKVWWQRVVAEKRQGLVRRWLEKYPAPPAWLEAGHSELEWAYTEMPDPLTPFGRLLLGEVG